LVVGVNFGLSGGAVLFYERIARCRTHRRVPSPGQPRYDPQQWPVLLQARRSAEVVVAGGQPTFQAFCSIDGTLWQTNWAATAMWAGGISR